CISRTAIAARSDTDIQKLAPSSVRSRILNFPVMLQQKWLLGRIPTLPRSKQSRASANSSRAEQTHAETSTDSSEDQRGPRPRGSPRKNPDRGGQFPRLNQTGTQR